METILNKTELARKIVTDRWGNGPKENVPSKIMLNLGDILKFLNDEKERFSENPNYFYSYYGETLIEDIEELYQGEAHPHALIHNAVIKEYKDFNWNNYSSLVFQQLSTPQGGHFFPTNILYKFPTLAHGNIVGMDKINNKYGVLTIDKEGVKSYLSVVDGVVSNPYDYFELALIHGMFGTDYRDAVAAIFETYNNKHTS